MSAPTPHQAAADIVRRAADPSLSAEHRAEMLLTASRLLEVIVPQRTDAMPQAQWDVMEPRAKARFLADGGTLIN